MILLEFFENFINFGQTIIIIIRVLGDYGKNVRQYTKLEESFAKLPSNVIMRTCALSVIFIPFVSALKAESPFKQAEIIVKIKNFRLIFFFQC